MKFILKIFSLLTLALPVSNASDMSCRDLFLKAKYGSKFESSIFMPESISPETNALDRVAFRTRATQEISNTPSEVKGYSAIVDVLSGEIIITKHEVEQQYPPRTQLAVTVDGQIVALPGPNFPHPTLNKESPAVVWGAQTIAPFNGLEGAFIVGKSDGTMAIIVYREGMTATVENLNPADFNPTHLNRTHLSIRNIGGRTYYSQNGINAIIVQKYNAGFKVLYRTFSGYQGTFNLLQ